MSDRRRRFTIHELSHPDPIIEERRPKEDTNTVERRRQTIIVRSSRGLLRRRERVEPRSSPTRSRPRPRAPSPPLRLDTPPLLDTMPPPKENLASKPHVPLPKPLPLKRSDSKSKTEKKSDNKSKDGPKVKVYEYGHRPTRSYDTGYASGLSSPWSVEDRSPLDYSPASRSPKPGVDKEPYEIITGSSKPNKPSRPNYIKSTSDGTKDLSLTTERKKTVRYVSRTPDSPGVDDEYVPNPSSDPYKDRHALARKSTKVLQEQLAQESETAKYNYDAARREEAQRLAEIDDLHAKLRKMKLERQIAEGRAAEAERKLKQRKIDELERREKELKQQQADEIRKGEVETLRRVAELAKRQWEEIEAAPSPILQRRPTALLEQETKPRRDKVMVPYGSTTVATTTQSPSVLDMQSPFLAPILEAQRDEDARRAREAKEERRRGTEVKETGRSGRQRPRRDDRYT